MAKAAAKTTAAGSPAERRPALAGRTIEAK
ncbi:sarcosine oxidase subunit gamma, partial [Mesorhizobium sp. M4A.F.Ca.ET.020.02.1.1]